METQSQINYRRISEAIEYLKANFKSQPNLDELAEKVRLSPFHFQRLFSEWAGISPKKFLQYLSVEHAKNLLLPIHAVLSGQFLPSHSDLFPGRLLLGRA